MPDLIPIIQKILLLAVPMLFSVTCHEVAHGYAALKLGDPTARDAGRLNLNPLKHLDATGTLVFVLTSAFAPFVIGWAKPVPVNPRYFKDPLKGMMYCSMAGPATNFALAALFAVAAKGYIGIAGEGRMLTEGLDLFVLILYFAIQINLVLGFFNLFPVPPLDGSKILAGVLPRDLAIRYLRLERYGMLIVVVLLATGVFGSIILPLVGTSYGFVLSLFGLPGSF